jgi:hypothetical protein
MLAFFGIGTPGDFVASGLLWLLLFFIPWRVVAFLIYYGFSAPSAPAGTDPDFSRASSKPDFVKASVRKTLWPGRRKRMIALLANYSSKLAARLREGVRLSQALDEVPDLLPPQVAATLRVGEEVGDVRKVLPACRGLLRDADSQTRNGFQLYGHRQPDFACRPCPFSF